MNISLSSNFHLLKYDAISLDEIETHLDIIYDRINQLTKTKNSFFKNIMSLIERLIFLKNFDLIFLPVYIIYFIYSV